MAIKLSGGKEENGIVFGNTFDKYGSKNPVVNYLMSGFDSSLSELIQAANPKNIHEVGCGEGYWIMKWNQAGIESRGSDFSHNVIEMARQNAEKVNIPGDHFFVKSIYDLESPVDSADLIVCCEVLEHLENPELALKALQAITTNHIIISVPREPLWCFLNLARGKYISALGNTPGHLQNWSKRRFLNLISKYFDIINVKSPLPWTMLLCKKK